MSSPEVSAVIPTTLRPELPRAIASARLQRGDRVEVVVVVDKRQSACSREELDLTRGADTVLFTGGGKGGGHARNTGVEGASGTWVAFLDDDDTWMPDKIAAQLEAAKSSQNPERLVVSCRVVQSISGVEAQSQPVPGRVIRAGEKVEEYLFVNRQPRLTRAAIFTSTLLVSRTLALAVPWDPSLKRHQDWDWLVRLQEAGSASFVQLPLSGAVIYIGSSGSISASGDWQGSLRWASRWKPGWSKRAYADFVAGQSLRYATQSRSAYGVIACLRELWSVRRLPSPGPLVLGLAGIAPRGAALRNMVRRSGRVTSA